MVKRIVAGYPLKFDMLQKFMIVVADDMKLDKRLELGAIDGFIREVPDRKDYNVPTDSSPCNNSKPLVLRKKLPDLEMVFMLADENHD